MAYVKHHRELNIQKKSETASPIQKAEPATQETRLLDKARRLIDAGDFEKAFALLKGSTTDDAQKNVRGICLMRMGKYEAALQLYRSLLLHSGSTWMRPNQPLVYKLNFATSLLLAGHPAGCAEVLAEINREEHPSVIRLRNSIKQWKRELSLWQRFLWTIGQEPTHKVALDYAPGEFEVAE